MGSWLSFLLTIIFTHFSSIPNILSWHSVKKTAFKHSYTREAFKPQYTRRAPAMFRIRLRLCSVYILAMFCLCSLKGSFYVSYMVASTFSLHSVLEVPWMAPFMFRIWLCLCYCSVYILVMLCHCSLKGPFLIVLRLCSVYLLVMCYLCSSKGSFYVSYTVASMFNLHSCYVLSMFLAGLLLRSVNGSIYIQSTFCLCSVYVPSRDPSMFRIRLCLC